jgi:hypothetical protein
MVLLFFYGAVMSELQHDDSNDENKNDKTAPREKDSEKRWRRIS